MTLPHARSIAATCLLLSASCGDSDGSVDTTSASLSLGSGATVQIDPSTPAGALKGAVRALGAGRVSTFMRTVVPQRGLEEMEEAWDEKREEGMSKSETQEFERFMAMLTTEDAEDMLFAMVKPSLAEAGQQMQMLTAMAPMMAAGMIEETGAPADAMAAVQSFSAKLAKIDIGSEENAKKAIAIVCSAARDLEFTTAEELLSLEFDEGIDKLDVVYGAALGVLDVYGLGLEETFESFEVTSLSENGDSARMEMRMTLYGLELDAMQFEMVRSDGRWVLPYEPQSSESGAPDAKLAR